MHNIKTNLVAYLVLFTVIQPENFYLLPIKLGFLAQKRPNLAEICILVILGQKLAFFAHFVPCPTKQQCKQGA